MTMGTETLIDSERILLTFSLSPIRLINSKKKFNRLSYQFSMLSLAWSAYIKFEMRQGEIIHARAIFERYLIILKIDRKDD